MILLPYYIWCDMNNSKGLGILRSVNGGRWGSALIISLTFRVGGNEECVFERDGISKDKNSN